MWRVSILLIVCSASIRAQRSYTIDTVVGTLPDQEGVSAAEAILFSPQRLAVGPDGSVFVSDFRDGIRRIAPDGKIFAIGGPGGAALAVDKEGTIYSVMGPELYVRRADGSVTTSRPSDFPGLSGNFTGVAVARDGDVVIADQLNWRVLRVSRDGRVSSFGGSIFLGGSIFNSRPQQLAVDERDNIYVSLGNRRIVRVSPDRTVTAFAGNGHGGYPLVGAIATESPFQSLGPIALASSGELYTVDAGSRSVVKISAGGVIEAVVWRGSAGDIAVDASGGVLIVDLEGKVVRVEADGTQSVVAGRDQFGGDGGHAQEALLKYPRAVAYAPDGSLYIADTGNNRIRKVAHGVITTVAGTGETGSGGDGGPAVEAQVAGPDLLAIDQEGSLYFKTQFKVRRLRPDGVVETIAGSGEFGDSGDGGPATEATFRSIDGLAIDGNGNLYIADAVSHRVRVVREGIISAYAGTGRREPGEDGVPAVSSPLVRPTRLAIDRSGNLLFFESGTSRLRRILTEGGLIETVSPTAPLGTPADELAAQCRFFEASGLVVDPDGGLLIARTSRICGLTADGTSFVAAGSAILGFAGDGGRATDALLSGPSGLAFDGSGSIVFADAANHRIRRLTPAP